MKRAIFLVAAVSACGGSRFAQPTAGTREAWVVPAGAATETADAPFRQSAPEVASLPPRELPVFEDSRLSNGARIITVKHGNLPIAAVRVVIDRGADQAPPGVASFVAAMLFAGTEHRSSIVLHQAFNEMGASIDSSASYDAITLDLRVLRANLEPALSRVADILRWSTFPDEEFDRARAQQLTRLDRAAAAPGALASDTLQTMLYPESHPYHVALAGTPEAIRSMTKADVVRFYKSYFVPSRTTFLVAGTFDRAALVHRLELELKAWTGESPPLHQVQSQQARPERRIMLIDRPGDSQSNIAIGWRGAPLGSEEELGLRGLGYALAGGIHGLLDRNMRGGHGMTYGVQAQLMLRRGPGPFVITTAVQRDRSGDALKAIAQELATVRATGLDKSTLPSANRAWLAFETGESTAKSMIRMALDGESVDVFRARFLKMMNVPREEILRVAREYLDPAAMQIVVVGDAKSVKPQLETAALGAVELAK
jgi:predicted Zn-dependent peptidase